MFTTTCDDISKENWLKMLHKRNRGSRVFVNNRFPRTQSVFHGAWLNANSSAGGIEYKGRSKSFQARSFLGQAHVKCARSSATHDGQLQMQ